LADNYTIVVPMAGYGSRMRPHTWSKPKPLIRLAGGTVLDYVINQFQTLPRFGQARFVFILSPHQEEQVIPYLKERFPDMEFHIVVQEEMRGQSAALYQARDLLTGPFLMAFSDTIIEPDLSALDDEPFDSVAWVKAVEDPRRFGVAETDSDGRVMRLIEKPSTMENNLVVVGFYYFKHGSKLMKAIEMQMDQDISLNGEYFIADAINLLLKDGSSMRAQPVSVWLDAGKPDALLATNRYLLDHGHGNDESFQAGKGSQMTAPVFIHPEAKVSDSRVGPHVSIGPGVSIAGANISNSIIDEGSHITGSTLTSSLVGRNARVNGVTGTLNIGDNAIVDCG